LDGETQSQIEDLVELREAHKRRKKHLELQVASLGLAAPTHIAIELESAVDSIHAIEMTLARLRKVEVRKIAAILPNSLEEDIRNVELHDRLNAIGHYVVNVESAIHKEIGGVLRLFDIHNIADETQRLARQKRVDHINFAIIALLFLIFLVLVLK